MSISDHWLTIMTCIECEQTPDQSPLYKCSLGHMTCSTCFDKIAQKGRPHCGKCNSGSFQQNKVSGDFLKKLKLRPGIGRPRRYHQTDLISVSSKSSDSDIEQHRDETITLEKLFRLPPDKIQHLLTPKAQNDHKAVNCMFLNQNFVRDDAELQSLKKASLMSSKPLVCLHSNCGQVVTITTFYKHFQHDHSEVPTFVVERSNELHFIHSVNEIEFNKTLCMAVVNLYELRTSPFFPERYQAMVQKLHQKINLGTFWLMVTGSKATKKSQSHVLYWIMTDLDEKFHCTIELSSSEENYCNSTFCFVNGILESNIDRIVNQLNCLNLCYSSMHNLLEEGDKLHLRIKIH